MTFYCKYGGIETETVWRRPNDVMIREWRDSLSFSLDDWYIVGNVIERFSPTWDVDIILIQNPLKTDLNDLSNQFTEMIDKGFKKKLLIDCFYVDKFYQDEWTPIRKIRPDFEFVKHWNGGIYHTVYKADKVEQIAPQLWRYDFYEPSKNWYKGKNRGYKFSGINLDKF